MNASRLFCLCGALLVAALTRVSGGPDFTLLSATRELNVRGFVSYPTPPYGESYDLTTTLIPNGPTSASISSSLYGVASAATMSSLLSPQELYFDMSTSVTSGSVPADAFGEAQAITVFYSTFQIDTTGMVLLTGYMTPGIPTGLSLILASLSGPDGDLTLNWVSDPSDPEAFILNQSLLLTPGLYALNGSIADTVPSFGTVLTSYTRNQRLTMDLVSAPDSGTTVELFGLGLLVLVVARETLPRRASRRGPWLRCFMAAALAGIGVQNASAQFVLLSATQSVSTHGVFSPGPFSGSQTFDQTFSSTTLTDFAQSVSGTAAFISSNSAMTSALEESQLSFHITSSISIDQIPRVPEYELSGGEVRTTELFAVTFHVGESTNVSLTSFALAENTLGFMTAELTGPSGDIPLDWHLGPPLYFYTATLNQSLLLPPGDYQLNAQGYDYRPVVFGHSSHIWTQQFDFALSANPPTVPDEIPTVLYLAAVFLCVTAVHLVTKRFHATASITAYKL